MREHGRFIADIAPIGSNAWRNHFKERYGAEAYEEAKRFVDKEGENDTLGESLAFALRSAARCYPDDRIYPDDTWSYNGPDDY